MGSFVKGIASYAVFHGGSPRSEYWKFFAAYSVFATLTWIVDLLLGMDEMFVEFGPVSAIYFALTLLPVIGMTIRRLHDTNRPGWWMLVLFIPVLVAIGYFILLSRAGDPASNRYGPVPTPT